MLEKNNEKEKKNVDKLFENDKLNKNNENDEKKQFSELHKEEKDFKQYDNLKDEISLEEDEEDPSYKEMALELENISNSEEMEEYIENNHIVDIAHAFYDIDEDNLLNVLHSMNDEQKASVIEQMDEDLQKQIFEMLSDEEAIDILEYMSPDDIADILGYIEIRKSKSILNKMKRSQSNKIRELLSYEADTAGGKMTTQYIAFKYNLDVKTVMEKLKFIAPKTEVIETIFVTNEKKELVGEVDLRDILIASNDTLLKDIMDDNVMYAYVEEDQEDVARMVAKYDLKVVPVINNRKNLLGIITIDDIIHVIQEENTEDILKLGGVSEEEDINSNFLNSVKQRLPWLLVNLGTAFTSSFVISNFSNIIEQVVVLSAIMSIVTGMGGNAGTQSLSVTIRALALDEIETSDMWLVVLNSFLIGLINGSILGILCGLIVYIFYGNFYISLIMFLAMVANQIVACMAGFIIPMSLKLLKIDPAMASGVLLTGITDIFGFLIFLSLATMFLSRIL